MAAVVAQQPQSTHEQPSDLEFLELFLSHIAAKQYAKALDDARTILSLDPNNDLILDYIPVLKEKIALDIARDMEEKAEEGKDRGEDDNEDDDDDDSSEDEDGSSEDGSDDDSEDDSEDDSNDSDDSSDDEVSITRETEADGNAAKAARA
ncbi:hypothetical protein BC829DRAFT_418673 [Chytridium lagenaria]|nr:hypothetical protein BC829DRAFT_418673 [Chytridium lagenaria]